MKNKITKLSAKTPTLQLSDYRGDVLTAEAREVSLTNKIGIYNIPVTNQKGEIVGVFKGSVYRTSKEW